MATYRSGISVCVPVFVITSSKYPGKMDNISMYFSF